MAPILNSVDLHKILVRAYEDVNITALLTEMIYDYFNNTSGVIKITYNDSRKKSIIVETAKVNSEFTIHQLKELFASFVVNIFNTKELEFFLAAGNTDYYKFKSLKEPELKNMALYCVTILDLSYPAVGHSVFTINLIN